MASQEMVNALTEEDPSVFDRALRYVKGLKGIGAPLADRANEAMMTALGPHGRKAVAPVAGLANVITQGADLRDMVDFSGRTVDSVRSGDLGGAAINAIYTAAAPIGMALPGSVGGYKKSAESMADSLMGVADDVDPSMPRKLMPAQMADDAPDAGRGDLPVRPARENLDTVVGANTIGGRVSGDEMVPTADLVGGPSLSARGQKAVDDIVEQMSGPDGFIERLIVDQDNNVIEGAHRVEALRRLGIEQVPITRVVDPTANLDLPKMGEAINAVGPIHSDHVNQITAQVGDMLAEVGGDPAKVLQEFDLPKGFERFFRAALDSVPPKALPTDEASRMAVNKSEKDASDIFGAGATRVIYKDQATGGYIEVVKRPDGPSSVIDLQVPEQHRRRGVGAALQKAALDDNPKLMGQVSSKSAARSAFNQGRRPYDDPNATIDDVLRSIDENSSVNMTNLNLPTDEASRMARAQEMGFDPENIIYHGTHQRNKITAFDDAKIGSANDAGYYGKGHYFADSSGEAKYYGDNVGEYLTNAKLLDLSNTSGDLTSVGHFEDFAPKLDSIGALDTSQRQSLKSLKALQKHLDDNIEYLPAQNSDGSDGWFAKVRNPAPEYTDSIEMNLGPRGFAESKEAAKESLKHKLIYEMDYHHPEVFPGVADHHVSLSDYVRTDLGSQELTDAAKNAGYEGIKFGDETVVFDPKNIRSTNAKFDPAKAGSADILAGLAGLGVLGAGATALPQDDSDMVSALRGM